MPLRPSALQARSPAASTCVRHRASREPGNARRPDRRASSRCRHRTPCNRRTRARRRSSARASTTCRRLRCDRRATLRPDRSLSTTAVFASKPSTSRKSSVLRVGHRHVGPMLRRRRWCAARCLRARSPRRRSASTAEMPRRRTVTPLSCVSKLSGLAARALAAHVAAAMRDQSHRLTPAPAAINCACLRTISIAISSACS